MGIFKEWGWPEDDVYAAFVKQPNFMILYEHEMSSTMDMIINKSGFDLSDVFQRPQCLAYQHVLLERGQVMKKWTFRMLLESTDKQLMKKITLCSPEAAPELLKLYQEKLELNSARLAEVLSFKNSMLKNSII